MPDVPEQFRDIIARWDEVQEMMKFVKALQRLQVITDSASSKPLMWAPNAENAVLDLRAITPTGEVIIPTPFSNPMTTLGDIIYALANGVPTRLGAGTAGQVLTVTAGLIPSWATPSAAGGVSKYTKLQKYSSQSVGSGSSNAISFSGGDVLVNADSIWSSGAPTRFTLTAGLWLLTGEIGWASSPITGYRKIYFSKSGTFNDYPSDGTLAAPTNSTSGNYIETTSLLRANAGDYVEIIASQINDLASAMDVEFCTVGVVRLGD